MTKQPSFTPSGLPGIERIPYGTHACHFYGDRHQLAAALLPYFLAGLRNNERCLWITASPLSAQDAHEAFRSAWDSVDDAIGANALGILDFDRWYRSPNQPNPTDMVQPLLDEEDRALNDGYVGLRVAGNTSFLGAGDLSGFLDYERAATQRLKDRRIVALCSYALEQCDRQQRTEIIQTHQCTFERDVDWAVVPSSRSATGTPK